MQNTERLYRISYLYMMNEEDAKDSLQEAIIKAFLYHRQLRDEALFDTWICRILINQCKNDLKKKQRESRLQKEIEKQVDCIEKNTDIELRLEVQDALEQLTEKEKNQIAMRYLDDMKISEIARSVNEKEGTVSSRIHRGLLKLRKIWGGEVNE